MKNILSVVIFCLITISTSVSAHNNLLGDDRQAPRSKEFPMQINGASIPVVPLGNCIKEEDCASVYDIANRKVVAYTHDGNPLASGVINADGSTVLRLLKPTSATSIVVRNVRVKFSDDSDGDGWAWFEDQDVCPDNKTENGYVCAILTLSSVNK